ncbi:MAG: hypothetical protein FWF00_07225 [Endomicrobia bacterium]|nr:hypothetical protein [Endomicrobiia bacterium]MCL2507458.1 hypothetical protein [Endomicrobiia bacterium]
MNPQEIKEFLKSIKDTDIEELQYESNGDSFYFKKNEVEAYVPEVKQAAAVKEIPVEVKSTLVSIKSTMVGTFSSAPSNDRPPFVREGMDIEVGQKVGHIEAMKIIKDVISRVKGKVVKVKVSNGEFVEYGQELFSVDTSK